MAEYYIDALLSGYRWNSGQPLETPVVLSYSIPTSQPTYYSEFIPYPAQHHDGLRTALSHVAELTNINFVEAASAQSSHIVFSYENFSGSIVGAAYYPYSSNVGNLAGDIFIDTRYQGDSGMGPGSQEYTVVPARARPCARPQAPL